MQHDSQTQASTYIKSSGCFVPSKVMSNGQLSEIVDTSDEWIKNRTGIHQRHITQDQYATDMAYHAALRALEKSDIRASELDLIVVATVTAKTSTPSCAVELQARLGATCPAFDIAAACAGFIYGLKVADGFFSSPSIKNVLVVGVENLSRKLNWSDRNTCVLFGDGAGCVILSRSEQAKGIKHISLRADGSHSDAIKIDYIEELGDNKQYVQMKGKEVYKFAINALSEICVQSLLENKLTAEDIDLVIPHQANLRIISEVAKNVGIPLDKFFVNIDKYGNTSSASIPIALDEAWEAGRIKKGAKVLICALGSGFTWGGAIIEF